MQMVFCSRPSVFSCMLEPGQFGSNWASTSCCHVTSAPATALGSKMDNVFARAPKNGLVACYTDVRLAVNLSMKFLVFFNFSFFLSWSLSFCIIILSSRTRNDTRLHITCIRGSCVTREKGWTKMQPYHTYIGNHRWIKYYEQLNNHPFNSEIRSKFGEYICQQWNKVNPSDLQIRHLKIWLLWEPMLGKGLAPPNRKLLW